MTARYWCRKRAGRWVITYRDGQVIARTSTYPEALAILRTIHERTYPHHLKEN